MDHKAFLRSLSEEDRLRLTEKSDAPGLLHLSAHWGSILAVGFMILAGVPGWPVLMVVQGILLIFLFTLLHETSHETPFRSRWLNTAVGAVCGFLIFLPPLWFRYFHLAHHRYTQDPARDPELARPKPATSGQYLRHLSGLPVFAEQIRTLWRNAMGRCEDAYVPAPARRRVRTEARAMLALYAGLAGLGVVFGAVAILQVWLLPLVFGQPFLRLYLLAEHGRCPAVANMFENTRTTFTSWAIRKLAWNMPFHAEHHAVPTVPFHRLPALHRLALPHLRVTEDGYARFHRTYVNGLKG